MKHKAASTSPKPATSYRKKKVVEKIADDIESYEDPTLKLYQ